MTTFQAYLTGRSQSVTVDESINPDMQHSVTHLGKAQTLTQVGLVIKDALGNQVFYPPTRVRKVKIVTQGN